MRQRDMNGVNLAAAFAAGGKKRQTPHQVSGDTAGFGWIAKGTARTKASSFSATKEQEAASNQTGREEASGRIEHRASDTMSEAAGLSPNVRELVALYARAKRNAPSQLHMRNSDKSICWAFQSFGGCSRGETCFHQRTFGESYLAVIGKLNSLEKNQRINQSSNSFIH